MARQIKFITEEVQNCFLSEASQSTRDLEEFLASPEAQKMRFGFEAEVVCTGFDSASDDSELERIDEMIGGDSLRDVRNFFYVSDRGGGYSHNFRAYVNLTDDYYNYLSNARSEFIESQLQDKIEELRQNYIEENPDEDPDLVDFEREATDALEEEFDESDHEFSDFCENEGYEYYSELADAYGLDWPEDRYEESPERYDSGTGYSLARAQMIQNDISSDLGFDIEAFEKYHGGSYSRGWRIEPDGSLSPDDPKTEAGMEIITPREGLPLKEGINAMMELFAWLRANKAYTSESATTGLHINLSLPDTGYSTVDWVKLVLFSGDEYVLKQFDRVGGYNDAAIKDIKSAINNKSQNEIMNAIKQMRTGFVTDAAKALINTNKNRTVTVNFKGTYVEFRVVGGDYLEMAEIVRQSVLRFGRALVIASNPETYQKEYAKKLYKKIVELSGIQKDAATYFANSISQLAFGPPRVAVSSFIQNLRGNRGLLPSKSTTGRTDAYRSGVLLKRLYDLAKTNVEDFLRLGPLFTGNARNSFIRHEEKILAYANSMSANSPSGTKVYEAYKDLVLDLSATDESDFLVLLNSFTPKSILNYAKDDVFNKFSDLITQTSLPVQINVSAGESYEYDQRSRVSKQSYYDSLESALQNLENTI